MDVDSLKIKVKEAFDNVESSEYLQIKIDNVAEKHRQNFNNYKALNPTHELNDWKHIQRNSIDLNSNSNEEITQIGFFFSH